MNDVKTFFFKACRTKQWIKEAHQYKDLYAG